MNRLICSHGFAVVPEIVGTHIIYSTLGGASANRLMAYTSNVSALCQFDEKPLAVLWSALTLESFVRVGL
jgi:hypothetical protein